MGMRHYAGKPPEPEEIYGCFWGLGIIAFFICVGIGGINFLYITAALLTIAAILIAQKM